MSNDTEIQPALTAEQWEFFTLQQAGKMIGGRIPSRIDDNWTSETRHAVAAQCLYDQPFGFAEDDITAIEVAMESESALAQQIGPSDGEEFDPQLMSLIARVRALLPPPSSSPER